MSRRCPESARSGRTRARTGQCPRRCGGRREGERGARTGRYAVDRSDDGRRQVSDRTDQRVVALAQLDIERGGVGLEALAQILAGTEGTARAGEDDGPDRRVPASEVNAAIRACFSGTVSALGHRAGRA